MKLLYSITAHEQPLTILDQCQNLIVVGGAEYIIVHINSHANNIYYEVESLLESNKQFDGIVYLNPHRFETGKNNYKLHLAHISNFEFSVQQQLKYDYFILEASNSLFIKTGVKNHIKNFDAGIGKGLIAGYWKDKILEHESLKSYFYEKCSHLNKKLEDMSIKGVHEGSFYRYEIANRVFQIVLELDQYCTERQDLPKYPTEEIWFQLALEIYSFKNEISLARTLTYLPWNKNLIWNLEEVKLILEGKNDLPDNVFSIKRIERQYNDPVRNHVRNFYNYERQVNQRIEENYSELLINNFFEFQNIRKLFFSNCLNENVLLNILHDPDAIKKLREDNKFNRFGIWNDITEIIDYSTFEYKVDIRSIQHEFEIVNLAYFAPSVFSVNIECFIGKIQHFSTNSVCTILSRQKNAKHLLKFLNHGGLNRIIPSANFLLQLILSSFVFNSFHSKAQEISFLERLCYLIDFDKIKSGQLVHRLIQNRVTNLKKKSIFRFTCQKNKLERIALFITGQVRSNDFYHFEILKKIFESYKIDIYISTWNKKGGYAINYNQLGRTFTNDALEYIRSLSSNEEENLIKEIIEYRKKNIDSFVSESLLAESFTWAEALMVKLHDENEKRIMDMNNAEKMYFHNNVWLQELGKKHFEDYDLIIKVRPDVAFLNFDLQSILNSVKDDNFITEDHNGWIYREWGFGIGDQVLIGTPKVMLELLTTYSQNDIATSCKEILKKESYLGHTSIGVNAWMNGFECLQNNFFTMKFSEMPKLSLNDVKKISENGEK